MYPHNQQTWRLLLTSLWIYLLLNMLFRDVHEFFRSGFLQAALGGVVNGNVVTEQALFYGGIALQIPLLMIVLPQLLPVFANRCANAIAAVFMLAGTIAFNQHPDMDDLLFAATGTCALLAILWLIWQGPRQPDEPGRGVPAGG